MIVKQDQQPEDEACAQQIPYLAFAFPNFCPWLSVLFRTVSRVSPCSELNSRAQELFLDLKQERDGTE